MSDQQTEAQRYQQAKAILHKALDLAPGERAAYLDTACGADSELRADVRSLLDAHEAAGSRFLKGPIARPATGTDSVDDDLDLTGQRVGAYRLERLIRRGGMGAVYLAARDDGEFTKHVAIKFIRPSIVTPALLKRFKVERQILADIDHPGIARLIDGGTTEQGMPFFIMEYVQGEALDDVLLRGPLPLPRAIRLAVSVAEVLEAVHS
jgi:serine/threonine protein kinase